MPRKRPRGNATPTRVRQLEQRISAGGAAVAGVPDFAQGRVCGPGVRVTGWQVGFGGAGQAETGAEDVGADLHRVPQCRAPAPR